MTSEEKLRVLLAGHAAFSERDVDGVIRIYAPDGEYRVAASGVAMLGEGAVGHDSRCMRAWLRLFSYIGCRGLGARLLTASD
jgi:hypothetical protein